MGLTTAMFTGLTGLNANQFRIDTIGNNVANVNTTAFRSSRAMFENQLSLLLSSGTAPGGTSGGTNPSQVGLGTILSSVQRDFQPGSIEPTGVPTDMAIEGPGFFVLRTPETSQAYTRNGSFSLDSENILVSSDGFQVQGYGVDDDFNVIPNILTDLEIPVGTLTSARATREALMEGNLNANGEIAAQGSILQSQALEEGPGSPATESTLLTALFDPAAPTTAMFEVGDVITIASARRGGRQMPETTLTVRESSTLGDFLTLLQDTLAINTDSEVPGNPGVRISDTDPPTPGTIIIEGNVGEENALDIELSAIRSSNPGFTSPFAFTEQQAADGESVFTSFIGFDSLGTPVQVNLTLTLESKSNSGTTWRFYADSPDDTDANPVLGVTGTLAFDNDGRLINVTNDAVQVDRDDTGALDPLQITLDFSNVTGLTTQDSTLVMTTQDGYATGSLIDFSVGTDGVLTGAFSNGLTRTLGQLAMATLSNPEGLVAGSNNLYFVGPNSGQPMITTAEQMGAGRILGGALELSNVDLTREFIGLITATTGFSASGRVISTANELLNELLLIAR